MKLFSKTLLSLSSGLTLLAPLSLTSCGQAWGYLNPISCGSSMIKDANDPFINFRDSTNLTDGNGQLIPNYLQSNFILQPSKSTSYAYSSPVTKWYQDKEDQEDEKKRVALPYLQWQHQNDGWKTAADEFSSSVTLYDQTEVEGDKIRRVYNNNENLNQLININLTSTIASSIQSFLASALQYQGSQIADNNDLSTSWGLESSLFSGITRTLNIKESVKPKFYEFVFSSANMHAAGKTSAFMKPTAINFKYDSSFFPFPTYFYDGVWPSGNKTISVETKQLLLGPNADANTKFYKQWRPEAPEDRITAYYTDLHSNQDVTIPYVSDEGKWEMWVGKCNQYLFGSVPVLVHVNNFGLEWVNPQKKNSFIPSDYFVTDKSVVTKAVGKSWSHLKDYVPGSDCQPSILSYKFNTNGSVKVKVRATAEGKYDERLLINPASEYNNSIDGNTFVVLLDYVVNEYDDEEYVNAIKEHFEGEGKQIPAQLTEQALANANAVSINGISNIFPAYLLGLQDETWFKKANTRSDESNVGYIINSSKVNTYKTKLSKLITFNGEDGHKPHARDISQTGKDLLAFLACMFGRETGSNLTIDMDFITPESFPDSK